MSVILPALGTVKNAAGISMEVRPVAVVGSDGSDRIKTSSVDKFGTELDYSRIPAIGGVVRNYKQAAGSTPPKVVVGEVASLALTEYGAAHVALGADGREAPGFLLRDFFGSNEFFSNTGTVIVGTVDLTIDSRSRKAFSNRAVNGNLRENSMGAATPVIYAKAEYVGPTQLVRLTCKNAAAYSVFVKIYDLAALPSETALPAPVMVYEIEAGQRLSESLDRWPLLNGLVVRVTKNIADADTTGLAAGDLRSFSLKYAR